MQNPMLICCGNVRPSETRKVSALFLPYLTDDSLLQLANKGLLVGPQPQDVIPKDLWFDGQPCLLIQSVTRKE